MICPEWLQVAVEAGGNMLRAFIRLGSVFLFWGTLPLAPSTGPRVARSADPAVNELSVRGVEGLVEDVVCIAIFDEAAETEGKRRLSG